VRQIDSGDVPARDQDELRGSDERRTNDAHPDLVAFGAEQVPAPPERVRDVGYDRLPLDEQVRVVIGNLVGDRDGHKRVHVGLRETAQWHAVPAGELA
jgi:hypothetical protein